MINISLSVMCLLFQLFLFSVFSIIEVNSYTLLSPSLSLPSLLNLNRRDFISRAIYTNLNHIIYKNSDNDDGYNNDNNKNALIIGYGETGNDIYKELLKNNYKTTITTTKPKRADKLKDNYNSVVVIPQMEIGKDEIFREAVYNNDLIIISDVISIFSVHTFTRTCQRVVRALENKNKKTTVCLISSINVYGAHTDGDVVNENSGIYVSVPSNSDNINWKINHISNAKLIRLGENYLMELAKINNNVKPIILRVASIWNKEIEMRNLKFNYNKTYPKKIGNTFMSLSYTNKIAKAFLWLNNNNQYGIYNYASRPFLRKTLYEDVNWINDDNYIEDSDLYYSMDINPLLPNSQRYNMRIDCSKLYKTGYKDYY